MNGNSENNDKRDRSMRSNHVRGILDLKNVPFLSRLNAEQLLPISDASSQVFIKAGDRVCRRGDPSVYFYLILSGRLNIHHGDGQIFEVLPGEFIGAVEVAGGERVTCDVTAAGDSLLLRIKHKAIHSLIELYPFLAWNVIKGQMARIRAEG